MESRPTAVHSTVPVPSSWTAFFTSHPETADWWEDRGTCCWRSAWNRNLLHRFAVRLPRGPAGRIQFTVKTQILVTQQFRDVCNLAVVQSEMFDDLIDGVETTDG